jgi:hypothetical protein
LLGLLRGGLDRFAYVMAERFGIRDGLAIGAQTHDRGEQFLENQGQILRPGRRRVARQALGHRGSLGFQDD